MHPLPSDQWRRSIYIVLESRRKCGGREHTYLNSDRSISVNRDYRPMSLFPAFPTSGQHFARQLVSAAEPCNLRKNACQKVTEMLCRLRDIYPSDPAALGSLPLRLEKFLVVRLKS